MSKPLGEHRPLEKRSLSFGLYADSFCQFFKIRIFLQYNICVKVLPMSYLRTEQRWSAYQQITSTVEVVTQCSMMCLRNGL